MSGLLPEWGVFKYSKTLTADGTAVPKPRPAIMDYDSLVHFCSFESWTADLATGIFALGPQARDLHGLSRTGECGLLTMVRAYPRNDHVHVLELFEQAALAPTAFCYSTVIELGEGTGRAVICIAESSNFDDDGSGMVSGVFLFPNVATGATMHATRTQQ